MNIKKQILSYLLISVLILTLFAGIVSAETDRCEVYKQRLDTYQKRVDRYCSEGRYYNQRLCSVYKRIVERYEDLVDKNCKPTCIDSDGGIEYLEKGYVKATGDVNPREDHCYDNLLIENFCKGDVQLPSNYHCDDSGACYTKFECQYGCQDGACLEDDCSSHQISIGEILNKDGKIAVEYKTVGSGANVKVELIVIPTIPSEEEEEVPPVEEPAPSSSSGRTSYPVPSSGGGGSGGGGAGGISCPIVIGGCSGGGPSNNVIYCSVQTECDYPEYQPNTEYVVKLTDKDCPGVYDKMEIQGIQVPDFHIYLSNEYQAKLEFKDNSNNQVIIPLLYSNQGTLKYGDNNDDLITKEGVVINKNDYLILSGLGTSSYALRYKGADKSTDDDPMITFKNLGAGDAIEAAYDPETGAKLKLGGKVFEVKAASDNTLDDFDVLVDLNADGMISDNKINLITFAKRILSIE